MTERPETSAEAIFLAAREIDSPEGRKHYVRGACRGDAQLAREVEALLSADAPSASFFGRTAPNVEGHGDTIDRYKLLEQIGEGGMGVVYMAEQTEPFIKKVALKIIKLGMDTKQVVARFEAERQALALMDHPHIAKVIDGGATQSGRPYFVMELVRGIPITEYCGQKKLSTRERLELFIPVCQAVQHAHQKGIIHRDLKPNNVLVTLNDGVPHPMVIDFGVAKATHQKLTEKTLFTQFSQMIGTPAYMSPEQAEMSRSDVDTRSDVYSLGALLYELLTGSPPFSDNELRSVGWAEMQRIIAETEPPRPSTRLSTLTVDQRTELSQQRHEDPGKIGLLLRRELDWIVMKCLEKDRNRRYETANGLAMDIRRFLSGDTPEAAPPTFAYQFRKFARRHKRTVAVAAAVAVILVAATAVSSWQAVRANREAAEALRQKESRDLLTEFLIGEFLDNGWDQRPGQETRADTPYAELLSRAAKNLGNRFADHPEIEVRLREEIGASLTWLGDFDAALKQLRQAHHLASTHLPEADRVALLSLYSLADLLAWTYTGIGASPQTRHFADEAMHFLDLGYERSLKSLGRGHRLTIAFATRRGFYACRRGELVLAEQLLEPLVPPLEALPPDDSNVAPYEAWPTKDSLQRLWTVYMRILRRLQGRHGESVQYGMDQLNEVLSRRKESEDPDAYTSRDFDIIYNASRDLCRWYRKPEEAAVLLGKAAERSRLIFGSADSTQALTRGLALACSQLGLFREALSWRREMLAAAEDAGAPQAALPQAGRSVVGILARIGDWPRAADELRDQRSRGISDPDSLAWELLLRHLEGNHDEYENVRPVLMQHLAKTTASEVSPTVIEILLVLPWSDADLSLLPPLAVSQLHRVKNDLGRSYYGALSAFREKRWGEVVEIATIAINARGPWRPRAALLGYFVGIAHLHLGNDEKAVQLFGRANAHLNEVLASGDLAFASGDPSIEQSDWLGPALALAAREQAQASSLGEPSKRKVDAAFLAEMRPTWEPIKERLEEANELCRRQRYADASTIYSQLLDNPRFHYAAAEHAVPSIGLKMATAFAHAGATNDYVRVCRILFEGTEGKAWGLDFTPLALCPDWLPADLSGKLDPWRTSPTTAEITSICEQEKPSYDHLLRIGMVCHRLDRDEDGLCALKTAMEGTHYPTALLSRVYAAMCAARLGDNDLAQELLNQASQEHLELLDHGEGRMNPDWEIQGMTELALTEARERIGSAPELSRVRVTAD